MMVLIHVLLLLFHFLQIAKVSGIGEYLPIMEAMRGHYDTNQTFSSILQTIKNQGGSVRFVFAFSTGHVGSTSFSVGRAYNANDLKSNNIKFLFERGGVHKTTYAKNGLWSVLDERLHVEHYYGPELLKGLNYSRHSVCVDLSHSNLYFYRGLVAALHENESNFTFVRITRERYETILSMQLEESTITVNFFLRDFYRYHPFEAMDRLVHPMPGKDEVTAHKLWGEFTGNQRVMWAIDETQARWERLLACHPLLPHIHVHWSKAENNIDAALRAIAEVIGVRVAGNGKAPRVQSHAGVSSTNSSELDAVRKDEGVYMYHLWPILIKAREQAVCKTMCHATFQNNTHISHY